MQSPAKAPNAEKLLYVETLRGIACILLVSYHVIGDTSLNGLQLPADHIYSLLNRMFIDVRMPLFSFISGFVFSCYARDAAMLKGKILSKVRRLLVPMIVVGSLHYWTQYAFAPEQQGRLPFVDIFFLPYEHFWYLQATFILMLAVFLLTYALKGNGVKAAILLLAPCLIGAVFVDRWQPDIFSSYKALYLAPYFLTGYLIGHAQQLVSLINAGAKRMPVLAAMALLLLVLFAIEFLIQKDLVVLGVDGRRAFGILAGLSACFFFFLYRFRSRFLAFIGDKSYAIFLLHVFFAAGSRIVLLKLMPSITVDALFVIGIIAGVAGPIGISWLVLKHPIPAFLVLGIKMPPTKKAMPAAAPTPNDQPASQLRGGA